MTTRRRSLKQLHRTILLDLVRRKGALSRKDLAAESGIRPSTITIYVEELIRDGFLAEVGRGRTAVGRKPILLDIRRDGRYAIGISIEDTSISSVVKTLRGDDDWAGVRSDLAASGPADMVRRTIEAARVQVERVGTRGRVQGIGVSAPGLVDRETGVSVAYTHYPWWRSIPLKERLEEALGLPVQLENDVKCMALAEVWFGAAQGKTSLVFVYVGDGCGGAIIIDDRLYHGAGGNAGEFGHSTIDPDGELCSCGSRGCLETKVSNQALIENVRGRLAEFPSSVLRGDALTIDNIAKAAAQSDGAALAGIEEMGRYLGIGLCNVVRHFDPGAIIIGGDAARFGEALLGPIRRELASRSIEGVPITADIALSRLGESAAAGGAAALVLAEVYGVML